MALVVPLKIDTGIIQQFAVGDYVTAANLGSGTANSGAFLRGDNVWSNTLAAETFNLSPGSGTTTRIQQTPFTAGSTVFFSGMTTGVTYFNTQGSGGSGAFLILASSDATGYFVLSAWDGGASMDLTGGVGGSLSWNSVQFANSTGLMAGAITSGTVAAARLGSGTTDNTRFLRGDSAWSNELEGNMGLHTAPPAWSGVVPYAFNVAHASLSGGSGGINTFLSANVYYDGAVWRTLNTGSSGILAISDNAGLGTNLTFYPAASVTAGSAASISAVFVVDYLGGVSARTFGSSVATGTAPLSIASTTLVTNLNADLLDGVQGSNYARLDASVNYWTNAAFYYDYHAAQHVAWYKKAGGPYSFYWRKSTSGLNDTGLVDLMALEDAGQLRAYYNIWASQNIRSSDYIEAVGTYALNAYYNAGWKKRNTSIPFLISGDTTNIYFYRDGAGAADSAFATNVCLTINGSNGNITAAGDVGANTFSPGSLANWYLSQSSSNPYINLDSSDYISFNRTINRLSVFLGSTEYFYVDDNDIVWCKNGVDSQGTISTTGSGGVVAPKFTSNVATGTQPYACTSTTLNTNLNADLCDGLHVHTARNNAANQIVRTNSSGYIDVGYINTNNGTENSAASSYLYITGSDGYFRHKQLANVQTEIVTSSVVNTAIGGLATVNFKQNANLVSDVGGAGTLYSTSVRDSTTANGANMVIDGTGGYIQRSTSSIRYKRNVQNATHGLAEVLQLRPVTYQGKGPLDGDKVHGGLISEEVHALGLTEFVTYRGDLPDGLAYGNMVSLLVKAIQELTAEVRAP